MARRGWKNESARHSLASRGVKTRPHKSARRHHMTIDEAEAADEAHKQLMRDLGDEEFIEARYDTSDPDSDYSIEMAAREEGRADAEADFWNDAVSELEKGPVSFEEWLKGVVPEKRGEVRERAAEILEERREQEAEDERKFYEEAKWHQEAGDFEKWFAQRFHGLETEYTKNIREDLKKRGIIPSKSITNDERSKAEVANFKKNKPKQYFAYYSFISNQVTTWTGDKLGDIVSKGEEWRSNMGDRRVQIKVKGINGVTYSGIAFLDAGDYTRLKAVKG